jgi:hypothetical protein
MMHPMEISALHQPQHNNGEEMTVPNMVAAIKRTKRTEKIKFHRDPALLVNPCTPKAFSNLPTIGWEITLKRLCQRHYLE